MWLQPSTSRELVTISCTPQQLACAWIQPAQGAYPYTLRAYKRIALNRLELAQGKLCNATLIEKHISSFLKKHDLANAYLTFALRGPELYEAIIDAPTTQPTMRDIPVPKKLHHVWDYRYLYTNDNAHAALYVCSISQALLLQYKLMAIRQHWQLLSITTISMGYIHAYVHSHGAAFRHSKLGHDLARCNNRLDAIVPDMIIRRQLAVPTRYAAELEQEMPTITPLLGLTMSEHGAL